MMVALVCSPMQAQNIEQQIVASQYGQWKVPGLTPDTYAFPPTSCQVQGGASYFYAFNTNAPARIVDGNPALSETVTPSNTVHTNQDCSISIAPVNEHQLPFYLTSATGGLQEALNQNLTTPATNMVILDSAWHQLVTAEAAVPATVIATVKGGVSLNLVDVTTTPYNFYAWNTSDLRYELVPYGSGGSGALGTIVNDVLANNSANTAAIDMYDFYATGSYSPAAAVAAAQAHAGMATITPAVGRKAFTNTGNVRVVDNRTDVPANARGVTEFGAQCDLQNVAITFTVANAAFAASEVAMDQTWVGRSVVAYGIYNGLPTYFESTIASITDGLHGTVTTPFPFSQTTLHTADIGHDDTIAIAQGMSAVGGGGTLIFPEGNCLTHTQSLLGQSPIGIGPSSSITGFPGEDVFAAPDPSLGASGNQGQAHIHDLTIFVDSRIDATKPWQGIVESVVASHTGLYRPIATESVIANNPIAPGWFQGPGANASRAFNGVASITAGAATMCVPTAEQAPAVGQTVVFPYLSNVFTATVSSTGSCSGGTQATLSASLPAGSTNTQAEWFAGVSPQHLATAIGSGTCPATITLANSISPAPGYESNVAPFGLIQIDGEQFSYTRKSQAANPSPANTLYGVTCAQNGTTRAAHSVNATAVPLNPFHPQFPWLVTPTLNSGDTTPAATAGYFPGFNAGNMAFAFPVSNGQNQSSAIGAWGPGSEISNLSFAYWPTDINGQAWAETNNSGVMYFVSLPYATAFRSLAATYLFYGIAEGTPGLENGTWATNQPTADGTHWDGLTLYAANPMIMAAGGQNSYSDINVYSNTANSGGANTCFYFLTTGNDQTGGTATSISLAHFKNLYCEPEAGSADNTMPEWEWDTFNAEIEDQHMGGGGEVYVGGYAQHWIGGNFNNNAADPLLNFGYGNTSDYSTTLGLEPKGNSYGINSLIDFGFESAWSGQTAQSFSSPTGPYGALALGGRQPIANQTGETFLTGNLTAPYTSLSGGMIYPDEFATSASFESQPVSNLVHDDTSPISHQSVSCVVGSSSGTIYCYPHVFNNNGIAVGSGQRIVPGKYSVYASFKDITASTNSFTFGLGTTCAGISSWTVPVTNAWPVGLSKYYLGTIDFSSVSGTSCMLSMAINGAATADTIQLGFVALAPVQEQINAQTINVTNINGPGGSTGCQLSPVTGIKNGYSCPTTPWNQALAVNQASGDTTITFGSTAGLPAAGCFEVDSEVECYTTIQSGTVLSGISRAQYFTTAAAHSAGGFPGAVSYNLAFGSPAAFPYAGMWGFSGGIPVLGVGQTQAPQAHAGTSVFAANDGGNEMWIDSSGAIHTSNGSAISTLVTPINIGSHPNSPNISDTAQVTQSSVPASWYQPQTLDGGHMGSLNVIATVNLTTPTLDGSSLPPGSSTASYVCTGIDIDNHLIPGAAATATSVPATWAFPTGFRVFCPYAAGVHTYEVWRTAGGGSQGYLSQGIGPGFIFSDYGGTASATDPGGNMMPTSNSSNPHISVAGTGTPCITMGATGATTTICSGAGVPATTCGTQPTGSGSLYMRTDGAASTSIYSCAGTTWTAVAIP